MPLLSARVWPPETPLVWARNLVLPESVQRCTWAWLPGALTELEAHCLWGQMWGEPPLLRPVGAFCELGPHCEAVYLQARSPRLWALWNIDPVAGEGLQTRRKWWLMMVVTGEQGAGMRVRA